MERVRFSFAKLCVGCTTKQFNNVQDGRFNQINTIGIRNDIIIYNNKYSIIYNISYINIIYMIYINNIIINNI